MRYLQVLPLTLTLVLFLVFPILLIGVVSFRDYNEFELLPDFVWTNYEELFTSSATHTIYFATLKFAFLTWVFTLLIGFTVAYFLAFHVHDLKLLIMFAVFDRFDPSYEEAARDLGARPWQVFRFSDSRQRPEARSWSWKSASFRSIEHRIGPFRRCSRALAGIADSGSWCCRSSARVW